MAINEDDLERDALLYALEKPKPKSGNTGVTGLGLDPTLPLPEINASQTPEASAPSAPAATYAMRGFDAGKLARDPSEQSEKYKIGNVFKKYDPKGGVTPELLAELNALGIAGFSGGGDKLTVENTKNDPRFGRGGTSDVVYGLKGQNADTAWQPWYDENLAAAAPGAGSSGLPPMSDGGMSSFQGIQSLAPTDDDFYKRLQDQIAQILGGPGAMDRDALLKMLGA